MEILFQIDSRKNGYRNFIEAVAAAHCSAGIISERETFFSNAMAEIEKCHWRIRLSGSSVYLTSS